MTSAADPGKRDASTRPRRTRLTAEQRRAAILEAATHVFAEQGFQQTALDRVAEAAGVSKALVYEHFSSKKELQATVLRGITEQLFQEIATAVAGVSDGEVVDGRERLGAGLNAYFTYLERNRALWHMLFRESLGREASSVILQLEPVFVAGIATVLSESPEASPLMGDVESAVRLRAGAQMLTGAMQWLGNWWVDNMELVPREQIVEWSLDAMWLGLDGWTAKLAAEKGVEHPRKA